MRRFLCLTIMIALVVIAAAARQTPSLKAAVGATPTVQATDDHEEKPPSDERTSTQSNHVGRSPVSPPPKSDETFVADTGYDLDRYVDRYDVGGGILKIRINIDRYYSNLITPETVDEEGFLIDSVRQELIQKHLLPEQAALFLYVFDVDHNVNGCNELDHVYLNGHRLSRPLSSGNETWSHYAMAVPIEMLKFPVAKGDGIVRPSAINKIDIKIDAHECSNSWEVEVDWGFISIASPIRPIVFAHGWRGTEETFETFDGHLEEFGIPSAGRADLLNGIQLLANTSPVLKQHMLREKVAWGVDKLNIVAHSKGGVVSRHALADSEVAEITENLITLSSPHHGVNSALQEFGKVACRSDYEEEDEESCLNSVSELSRDTMRAFNYSRCISSWFDWITCYPREAYWEQDGVSYTSFGTVGGPTGIPELSKKTATYPWDADARPFPDYENLDVVFPGTHTTIPQDLRVYECMIHFLDPEIHDCSPWTMNPTASSSHNESIFGEESYQMVVKETGVLPANTSQTVEALLDGGEQVIFSAFSDEPLSFSLVDPNGQIIDPTVANSDPAIEYVESEAAFFGAGWLYQYAVSNAIAGTWQKTIEGTNEVNYFVWTETDSPIRLYQAVDEFTYRPNDLVTVLAVLSDTAPLLGTQMTGLVVQPDASTLPLTFYDDGTHGDTTANDGIYAAQFNASSMNGYSTIEVSATNGNVVRTEESMIAVAVQSATIGLDPISDLAVDTNDNQLYDVLTITLPINVINNGHFQVSGTLVDSEGEVVGSASYSTRMAGLDPLSVGQHTIHLGFNGEPIRQHGVDGPYTLTDLTIYDQTDGSFEVDMVENAYTTEAYQAKRFEGPLLTIVEGSEQAIDMDGDGLYDLLWITVMLDGPISGAYSANGRLVTPQGTELEWDTGLGELYDDDTPMSMRLMFQGGLIGANGENGPYMLRDLSVYDNYGVGVAFSEAYTTTAYNYTEFESRPSLKFESATSYVNEAEEEALITVTLNQALTEPLLVSYYIITRTATSGEDYEPGPSTLTFEPGQTSQTISLPLINDSESEPNEWLTFTLSYSENALLGSPREHELWIIDDDSGTPTVQFESATIHVNEDYAQAIVAVELDKASAQTVSVDYESQDGSATAGADYESVAGTLTFEPGEVRKTFNVPLINDDLPEANESVQLSLSSPTGATIGEPADAQLIINDDGDEYPTVQFAAASYSVNEDQNEASITVTLNKSFSQSVSVDYESQDDSATAGSDYQATQGTLTFAPGEVSQSIAVPIINDDLPEANESLQLTLSSPTGAIIGEPTQVELVINDDGDQYPTVQFSAASYSVNEDQSQASVTVTLNKSFSQSVSVEYESRDGSAGAGVDYESVQGTLTFAPYQVSRTFAVPLINDDLPEASESVQLRLSSPTGATIGEPAEAELIINDDGDEYPTVQFAAASYSVNESKGNVSITVRLNKASQQYVSVKYSSRDGSATAGSDYKPVEGRLTFTPGQVSKSFNVALIDDSLPEPNESLQLYLSDPGLAVLGHPNEAELVITDNDEALPKVQFKTSVFTVKENGDTALITVNLSKRSERTVRVNYYTRDGSAKNSRDYKSANGTLIFRPGQVTQYIKVPIINDRKCELTEYARLYLSRPYNAELGTPKDAKLMIYDDDCRKR